ncbi:hypothetical protein [Kitasatospora camelliae]|uniref:Uncharacterized protein n=1 Tax=Kitasatospora camelliae TaxID=3156397 RepID=A0AAU8K445_9ACTN
MATRFWLTSSAPPYTPTTKRGAWDVSTGEDVQYLGRKPAGSAGTSTINVGSTAADRDILLHRSISDGAVKAGTVAGTVTWMIGAKESNAALNGFFHLHIYVTSGDTDTPRGTLLTDSIGATEFGTTAIGATEGAKTLSSVAVQVGDRIVVEIGYRANAGSSTQNATINYGNTGTTDLSAGSASVTSQPGWVEFSGADGLWTKSFSALTDQFPSSIDSKWTASAGVSATGGRARINCTTATPNMYTATAYEIQSSSLAFKVPTLPVTGGGSTVTFSAYLMPGPTVSTTNLEFEYSPNTGNLVLRSNVGGTDASPTTLTYNATDHLWWRFREASGQILLETSPDNSTWTTRRTISTPSQWMLQGNLIAYFEASRASGTADFAEIDDINPPAGQTQALGVASASETAQASGKAKTKTVTLAAGSETAQALGRAKRISLGVATEANAGQPVGHTRQRAAAPTAAVETGQPLGRTKARQLGPATSTDATQALPTTRGAVLGQAAETASAQPITATKRQALTPASTADTATDMAATKGRLLSPAAAADTASAIVGAKTRATGAAATIDTAQPTGAAKTRATSPAAGTDVTQGFSATKTKPLTPAAETATSPTVGAAKSRPLAPAAEQAEAQPLTGSGAYPLPAAQHTDTAQPIGRTKTRALPPASTLDGAQPVSAAQPHPIDPAAATDSAQPITPTKRVALGPAFDYATVPPAGRAKTTPLGRAAEAGTAQALTAPGTGTAHGIRLIGRPATAWTAGQTRAAWASSAVHTRWDADPVASPWDCRNRQGGDVNSQSTEYHEVPVTWTRGDPTAHTVQMAVIPVGHEPDDTDWHTAAWDTDDDGTTVAKLLVGPDGGAVAPTPGTYRDWVSIDAPPEHPVLFTPPFEIN